MDRRLTRAQAQELAEDLIARAKESSQDAEPTNDEDTHVIPPDLRKAKTAQVMKLLEREYVNLLVFALPHVRIVLLMELRSALVEAAQARLERLNISVVS